MPISQAERQIITNEILALMEIDKSKAEEADVKEIMDGVLQEGRTIKDKGTGIYFKVVGDKLHTSYPIHTEAGGDPDVYWAWEKSQEGSDTFPPEND